MKKLYALTTLIFIFFSCSETDEFDHNENAARQPIKVINALDPTKLAKVIFNPGLTEYERHWYFYPNGLLKKITNTSGTILQTFFYDANNNLIKTVSGTNSAFYDMFFYDSDNHLTSVSNHYFSFVNVTNLTFFSNENKYVFGDNNNPSHTDIFVTPEKLFEKLDSYSLEDYGQGNPFLDLYSPEQASYSGNNQTGYTINANPDPTVGFWHDDKINPLKQAVYPICKAFSIRIYPPLQTGISEPWRKSEYNSQNNVTRAASGQYDRTEYEYDFNAHDLPTIKRYNSYFQDNLENSGIATLYYYQGDPIP